MIAREGWPFVIIGLLLTVLAIVWLVSTPTAIGIWIVFLLAVLTAGVLFFFRDPDRTIPEGDDLVLSPGDGRVIFIGHPEEEQGADERIMISVFLSVFNVHVNRAPVTGNIVSVLHIPGSFYAAFTDMAGHMNERTDIEVRTDSGHKVRFRQVAGMIARRIVCRLHAGGRTHAGERFGLIKFGSRVDVYIHPDSRILVERKDRVRAGETILAQLPKADV